MEARPNAEQAERWSGDAARHWIKYQAAYDRQLAPFGHALIEAAAPASGDRALDVGCGTGTTTLAVASAARSVVGVDLSAPLVARGVARGEAAGCTNAQFVVADAQVARFDESFDLIVSRFGLMFFDDPAAAFANLRYAAVPGGRLVAVCWQGIERNDWMRVPGAALARVTPVGDVGEPGQPGPFALGDPDRCATILAAAGWRDVALEPVAAPVVMGGGSLDETMSFLRGGSLLRSVLADVSPEVERAALDAVREALAPYTTDEGVTLSGAAWLIRAAAGSR